MADNVELSTLGGPIKTAYEGEPDTNAFTDAEKTKLANLSAVAGTGNFSDLINKPNFVDADTIGVPGGIAPLDASGFVPAEMLNVSGLQFKGAWSPTTNTPELLNGSGIVGDFYKASSAGSRSFGGQTYDFSEGDWVIFAAGVWQRIGSNEMVSSVNGKLGAVVLTASDVGAKSAGYTPTWGEVAGKPDIVNNINGKSGIVTLGAADVGARATASSVPWGEVSSKPKLYSPRGPISPPIPTFLRRTGAAAQAENSKVVDVTGTATPIYDHFSMLSDGKINIPAWATHVRISAGVRIDHLDTGKHMWGAIRLGVGNHATATVHGSGSVSYPSLNMTTGIVNLGSSRDVNVVIWHNNGNSRDILTSGDSFINIELFEAI